MLVFTRTKHGANKLVQQLERAQFQAQAIHGNKSQSAREQALENFRNGAVRVLVATDIAARGLDVDDVTHVINYDLPNEPESYVHRIGRTARAGASGVAYSFCDGEERKYLRDIERLIRLKVPVIDDHPYPDGAADLTSVPDRVSSKPKNGYDRGHNGSRQRNQAARGKNGQRRGRHNLQRSSDRAAG